LAVVSAILVSNAMRAATTASALSPHSPDDLMI
jgi:phosphohistidine phosphatase SixA